MRAQIILALIVIGNNKAVKACQNYKRNQRHVKKTMSWLGCATMLNV